MLIPKKSILKLLILAIGLAPLSVAAQIEVHDGGQISIGGNPSGAPASQLFVNSAISGNGLYVKGNATASAPAYIDGSTAFGYSLFVKHNNVLANTCAIQTLVPNAACNSYGLDVTTGGSSVFYVTGTGAIFHGGSWITSDSSLKKNIALLSGTLDKLDKIHGYTYNYRTDVTLDKGVDKGKKFMLDSTRHAGFMANEIQQIAPYAVKEMKNGKLAVDYIQMVPFLLEGIKELNAINKQQEAQINLLQSRFNNLAASIDSNGGNYKLTSTSSKTTSDFTLYQNNPNPFNKETSISYNLKSSYSSAYIYIFDLQGGLKKTYQLDNSGSISVKNSELSAGMYLYSLVVDGRQIDIKRMLLTN